MDEVSVNDVEGTNGLDYVSAQDPRVPTSTPPGSRGVYPDKYTPAGNTPVPVASFVEARLIEAEAALHDGGDWLAMLNALRTDGSFTTSVDPDDPMVVDTTWGVGTGAPLLAFTLPGLRPLDDPIDPDARIDLLFRERAFWLFLTGQRQSDLRRLVAVYDRRVDHTYPVGGYSGGTGLYGTDVNAPVPLEEQYYNPHYSGCINRGA
jgi:hypothetical protein